MCKRLLMSGTTIAGERFAFHPPFSCQNWRKSVQLQFMGRNLCVWSAKVEWRRVCKCKCVWIFFKVSFPIVIHFISPLQEIQSNLPHKPLQKAVQPTFVYGAFVFTTGWLKTSTTQSRLCMWCFHVYHRLAVTPALPSPTLACGSLVFTTGWLNTSTTQSHPCMWCFRVYHRLAEHQHYPVPPLYVVL